MNVAGPRRNFHPGGLDFLYRGWAALIVGKDEWLLEMELKGSLAFGQETTEVVGETWE